MPSIKIGDVLEEFNEKLGARPEPEILTLTEKRGFIAQRERFKKRLATEDTTGYKVIRKSDVAFNPYLLWAGAIAQNILWDEAIISPAYPTFRIKKGFDPRFVNYRLSSAPLRQRFDSISFGAVPRRRRAATESFLELEFGEAPPLERQKQISRILDKSESLLIKRNEAITKLDKLLQAVFLEMFGDPLTTPKVEVVPLNAICSRITDGTHQSPKWADTGIPFLFQSNVKPGEINYETKKMISPQIYDALTARCPIEYGDVLYTIVGSYGNAAMVRTNQKFCFQRHIAHLKPSSDTLPEFLEAMMNHPIVKRQADERVTGIAQKTLILKELKEIKVLKPPVKLQEKFRDVSNNLRRCRNEAVKQAAAIQTLVASLQYRAFNGA